MIPAPRVRVLLLVFLTCLPSLFPATTPAPAAPNLAAAIADARRNWGNDAREIADLLGRLKSAAQKAVNTDRELKKERRALTDLEDEERETMKDLRNGAFCTGCGKTRSEIERNGDTFPHPGQQARPATPAELDAAKRGFEGRRTALRRRIETLQTELQSADADVMSLHHRLLTLMPAYHRHLADEQENRLAKWLNEKNAAETELQSLRFALAAPAAKDADADAIRKAQERLQTQFAQRVNSARIAEDRARQEERQFRKDALASIDYLAGLARPIPDRINVSGFVIASTLRNPPKPMGYTVPGVVSEPLANNAPATETTSTDLKNLLEGKPAAKEAPQKPSGEKSVQDLLNGK